MSEKEPPLDKTVDVLGSDEAESVQREGPNPEAVEKLSHGLMDIFEPPLDHVRKQLRDLTTKQERLVQKLEEENGEFQNLVTETDLHEMMAVVKGCLSKLTNVKRDMNSILDRTTKLKKRALRLQQAKQKEALERTQEREERLLREQNLIADPAHLLSPAVGLSSSSAVYARSAPKEVLASPSEIAEETLGVAEESPQDPATTESH